MGIEALKKSLNYLVGPKDSNLKIQVTEDQLYSPDLYTILLGSFYIYSLINP